MFRSQNDSALLEVPEYSDRMGLHRAARAAHDVFFLLGMDAEDMELRLYTQADTQIPIPDDSLARVVDGVLEFVLDGATIRVDPDSVIAAIAKSEFPPQFPRLAA